MGSKSPEKEMLGQPTNFPFFCHFLGKLIGYPNKRNLYMLLMMIINHGIKSIALQAMRTYVAAATGSAAEAMSAMPQSELEQSAKEQNQEVNNMGKIQYRKFNGKPYRFVGVFKSKSDAQRRARNARKRGQLARVVKEKLGYGLWLHGVKPW